jgi:hypothetical protein
VRRKETQMPTTSVLPTHTTSKPIHVGREEGVAHRADGRKQGRKRAERIVSMANAVKSGDVETVDISDLSDNELLRRYSQFITK